MKHTKKQNITVQALRYTMLPGFIPRIQNLIGGGFMHIAYLLAIIYNAIRLLPANHPYLNPSNLGAYGIRHVIAAAANNLTFSRKNIDQIIVFFTVLGGMVILALQIILFIMAIMTDRPVLAAPQNKDFSIENLFYTESAYGHGRNVLNQGNGPTMDSAPQDLAFIAMDRVFGYKGIFDSCVTRADIPCFDLSGNEVAIPEAFPTKFHNALHTLFAYYSYGLFTIGLFIIIYFVTTIVAETAVSGAPFTQRMNKAWAPVRFVLFFALIVPMGSANLPGLNGAQYITLHAAKYGSNFATNAWGYFVDTLLLKEDQSVMAVPKYPNYGSIMQFIFLARACKMFEEKALKTKTTGNGPLVQATQGKVVEPLLVRDRKDPAGSTSAYKDLTSLSLYDVSFNQALEFSRDQNIIVSFGYKAEEGYAGIRYPGDIIPVCGQIIFPIQSSSKLFKRLAEAHFDSFFDMWWNIYQDSAYYFQTISNARSEIINDPSVNATLTFAKIKDITKKMYELRDMHFDQALADIKAQNLIADADKNQPKHLDNLSHFIDVEYMIAKGWGGAGLWYNRIAEINGQVADGVMASPRLSHYPKVMEYIKQYKERAEESVDVKNIYAPSLQTGEPIRFSRPVIDAYIAPMLFHVHSSFAKSGITEPDFTGNVIIDFINFLFGTEGMYEMRYGKYEDADGNIIPAPHPMAQLSALGKSMMFASIRNIAGGFTGQIIGGIFGANNQLSPPVASTIGSFFQSIGMTTLAISFVLFYILPFLPFIYFMFAISGWVKSIFEAMVAMPLWALAHLRIDGDGIPGKDAANGYYLILEIFLRPILIVFGLVASVVVFQAMAETLHNVFEALIRNVGGLTHTDFTLQDPTGTSDISGGEIIRNVDKFVSGMRAPIDQFFTTILYVIMIYMVGLACFKMIDAIPNQILRWIGADVSGFQETAGDIDSQITQSTFTGTTMLTSRLSGGQLQALLAGR